MLVTVSDKRNSVDENTDGVIDYYTADVTTAQDYYPFGMLMPGRRGSLGSLGTWQGTGSGSLPAHLGINNRSGNTPSEYKATTDIEFTDGFESGDGDAFEAFITADNSGGNSGNVADGGRGYRYGFNGQEKSDEIDPGGNSMTAEFWQYDARIGRRWNLDPKPNHSISSYATFYNNPIWFNDRFGDSSIIDNKGYMTHYDAKDKDLRVFMQQDGKLTLVGNLGGKIDASGWFGNLLQENSKESKGISTFNPWGFKNRVRQYGKWDYKYRSAANKDEDGEVNKMPSHILGIAFYRKDKENGSGDLPETSFAFNGSTGRAEDLNNFHFGVVGKAYNVFSEEFMLRTAGSIEMGKWADDYKQGKRPTPQVPASWRPIQGYHRPPAETEPILGWPYGDNPEDSKWIIRGFRYYNATKKQ